MSISTNLSAITANQTYLNTNANNVANINTKTITPSQTTFSDKNGVVVAKTASNANHGLASNLVGKMIALNSVAANVSGIQTQNKMFGSLLDIKA